MKRLFKALSRKDRHAQAALLAEWEDNDPPRALLEYAALGNVKKLDDLLAKGIDPNAEVMVDVTVDTVMETPLCAAASAGKLESVKRLLAAGAQVDKPAEDNYTPLMCAAVEGRAAVAEYLIAQGADIHVRENIFGHTPLHKAARLGRPVTVERLLAAGASREQGDFLGHIAENTICQQCGGNEEKKEELRRAIQAAFDADTHARDSVAADAARHAQDMARAAELQRDMPLPPAPVFRKRGPQP